MIKKILQHAKEKKDVGRIAVVLGVGLILIFLGIGNKESDVVTEVSVEDRIASACREIDGVGECSVLVYYSPADSRTDEAKVESVIVICDGADSVEVRKGLIDMLSAFFGIGTNRIRVEKMK